MTSLEALDYALRLVDQRRHDFRRRAERLSSSSHASQREYQHVIEQADAAHATLAALRTCIEEVQS